MEKKLIISVKVDDTDVKYCSSFGRDNMFDIIAATDALNAFNINKEKSYYALFNINDRYYGKLNKEGFIKSSINKLYSTVWLTECNKDNMQFYMLYCILEGSVWIIPQEYLYIEEVKGFWSRKKHRVRTNILKVEGRTPSKYYPLYNNRNIIYRFRNYKLNKNGVLECFSIFEEEIVCDSTGEIILQRLIRFPREEESRSETYKFTELPPCMQ